MTLTTLYLQTDSSQTAIPQGDRLEITQTSADTLNCTIATSDGEDFYLYEVYNAAGLWLTDGGFRDQNCAIAFARQTVSLFTTQTASATLTLDLAQAAGTATLNVKTAAGETVRHFMKMAP